MHRTVLAFLGILVTGQLLQAEERNDPSLALPFQSKALHTVYREHLSDEEKLTFVRWIDLGLGVTGR